jgi:hypothetical protein
MITPIDHWHTVSQYNLARISMNFLQMNITFPGGSLVIFKPTSAAITTLPVNSYWLHTNSESS